MTDYPEVYPDLPTGTPQFLVGQEEADLLDDIEVGRKLVIDAALGKKVWWCEKHNDRMATASFCYARLVVADRAKESCPRVERLLIPIPDPQPEPDLSDDHRAEQAYDHMGFE